MRVSLTDKKLKAISPPAKGRTEIFDTGSPGLSLRITARGGRSWSLMYRFAGHLRRDTLGEYPEITLAKARDLAREALELVSAGTDPRKLVEAQEAAEAARKANTVEKVAAKFIEKHVVAEGKRWRELQRVLKVDVVPAWGDRPVTEITKADVRELIETIGTRAPVQANRTLTVLRIFFRWAAKFDHVPGDPTVGVDKTAETERQRVLSDEELRAFWSGCDELGHPFGTIFKLLALTAQRKGEIGNLRWDEINWRDKFILIPRSRYKTKRDHVVPMAPLTFAILERLKIEREAREAKSKEAEPLCFSTTGTTPVSGFSRAKLKLDTLMTATLREQALNPEKFKLAPWIIHDLRRTASTHALIAGVPEGIVDRIRGKTQDPISRVYNCYAYLEERRQGLETWERRLLSIVSPPPANVTPMKRRTKT